MSENQVNARFKLSKSELSILVDWIMFQENMSKHEIDLADKLYAGLSLLNNDNKFNCFYLRIEECVLVIGWYDQLIKSLLDQSDIGLHVVLNIHLDELTNESSSNHQA